MDLELILKVLEEALQSATDVEWPNYHSWHEEAEVAAEQIRKKLGDDWHSLMNP